LKRILSLFLFILFFGLCYGQNDTYYFKNYQVQNGLSSNTITTILQDKKGFIWIGTRNGLNRFDGNTFKVFHNVLSDAQSLGSNSIFSLFEDEKEQLWVGTYSGIYLYNPQQERFSAFKLIPPGEVRFIAGDNEHNIWIISNLTLYKYNQLNATITSFKLDNDQTIALHISKDGNIWTATTNGFVKHYNPKTGHFIDYNIKQLNKENKLIPIEDLYPIGDSALLIGCMNKVLLFNYKTSTVKNIFKNNAATNDVHVHKIFRQSADEYWLGTESGIYIFNIKTFETKIVSKDYSNPYSISDNVVSAISRDKEGGIWIGTFFGGVNYYSKQYNDFKKYFPEPDKISLSGNIVHEICKDKYGQLWVGTEDAGLNRINLKTGAITQFKADNKKGSISYRNIHGIAADGNELWIGTYEHGLDVMDLTTNKVIRHYDASDKPNSLASNFIISLYKTRAGDILAGTWNGLFKYDRKKDNFDAMPFFNSHIQCIHEDENGTLWVGTYGDGVYYLNDQKNIKGRMEYRPGITNSLINNYVNNLFEDKDKNFWFCTERGLSFYNSKIKKIKNYTIEDGLPDNQIFRIMEDDSGKFWISTAKGLSRFDPSTNEFNNYHSANGLPTEQFNYNSSFKNDDGTLFFGTVKGMISFNPNDFVKNTFTPPVYITGFQINNDEAVIGNEKTGLNKSITYTKEITLPSNSSNISIDVAALSYIIPEMNEYAYQMEGIDKGWTILKKNRRIFYTKLPPGKYTFRVKGSNSEGVWNNKETVLNLEILPPLWATKWAYLLYFLVAAAIIITIIRYYHLAITEKNKRRIESIQINTEREIYNAKINFFTNVAHEIRTPLTLIKMPLDKLLNSHIADKNVNESLHIMKKNTNRLIDLTNQLLDFRKAEANKFSLSFSNTDVNELLTEVFCTFKPAAEQKNLSYRLDLPRITLHAYVDTEAVKKIVSNLLNNAIKYAEGIVRIKLLPFSSEDTSFNIEVRNDGYTIPEQYRKKIFEAFYRIKETEKEAGTGIGLPLARSLAQLHNGSIALKISDDKQNIFLLSLPIHQETEINLHKTEEEDATAASDGNLVKPIDSTKPMLLLVEDNKEILNYIKQELTDKYNVITAADGQDAIHVLENENVHLVVSDIMMPIMDGIELCKKIKNDFQHSHIPIVLITAKNSLQSKIEGLEVGADAYIEKPFSIDHLQAQIANLLSNRNIIKEYFARSPLTHIKGIACSKADKEFLENLNDAIYEHITDEELDVDRLSAIMNMSKATLYRKIKGLSDLTPNELINLTRLKKAAQLLSGGDYKINEVAYMIGYSLPTNFSRDFQKQFGISPSGFIGQLDTR
jgi:ligand-binding sensor domain-containing protein/signal transduction histidine kinase/DNA-binding response OmpR family regulator